MQSSDSNQSVYFPGNIASNLIKPTVITTNQRQVSSDSSKFESDCEEKVYKSISRNFTSTCSCLYKILLEDQ